MKLYDSSLLVYVTVGVWTARKLDKRATTQLTHEASAVDSAARVNKHLLANADAHLKAISAIAQRARRLLDERTLPWDDAGNRICSNAGAMQLVADFDPIRREFHAAVDEFVAAYPDLRELAMTSLGDLANADDYPLPETLRGRFHLRLTLSPVADSFVSEVRKDVSTEQASLLERHYQSRVEAQQSSALMAAWERLRSDAALLVDRLTTTSPTDRAKVREAVVNNLVETSQILQGLNVFQSAELDTVCRDVQNMLRGIDAQALREDTVLSQKIRTEADDLVARLTGLLGA